MGLNKKIIGREADAKRGIVDLDAMAHDWASKTVAQLKKNIDKKGLVVTRELIDSLNYTINDGDPPSIDIYFSHHGRYLEIKQLFWNKPPPFDAIHAWVKKQPISEWAFVPGYKGKDGIGGMDIQKAQSRIAWGIMKDRAGGEVVNQYGRWKRAKQWQNPSAGKSANTNLGTAIGHLRHLLEDELSKHVENVLIYTLSE
jgi:hypothetical protein